MKIKDIILTLICTLTLFVPWTLIPLRSYPWALESPMAEILIYTYAAFMLFSGIFAVLVYSVGKVQNRWMQICALINGLYAVGGTIIFVMILLS